MLKRRNDVLLVDGYNMIGDWPELIKLKDIGLEEARNMLLNMLADYQGFTGIHLYVVFDAYQTTGQGATYKQHGITVVYTKEKETADECIERLSNEWINKRRNVYVATSDMAEQHVIFGHGALRISARELLQELKQNAKNIDHALKERDFDIQKRSVVEQRLSDDVRAQLEQMRRGK